MLSDLAHAVLTAQEADTGPLTRIARARFHGRDVHVHFGIASRTPMETHVNMHVFLSVQGGWAFSHAPYSAADFEAAVRNAVLEASRAQGGLTVHINPLVWACRFWSEPVWIGQRASGEWIITGTDARMRATTLGEAICSIQDPKIFEKAGAVLARELEAEPRSLRPTPM